jgi:flagellar basal body-associated protein FliL
MLARITMLEALAAALVIAIGVLIVAIALIIFWTGKEEEGNGAVSGDEPGRKHPR